MDLNAYGPALMHRCRHAPMPSIHIHSRWSQYHQTAGKNYVRAVRNGQCADEIINKPSIVANAISAIMLPVGNTLSWTGRPTGLQMPPCQTSTFTSDGVNIIKQPEGITLEPTKMANVPAEVQDITNQAAAG